MPAIGARRLRAPLWVRFFMRLCLRLIGNVLRLHDLGVDGARRTRVHCRRRTAR